MPKKVKIDKVFTIDKIWTKFAKFGQNLQNLDKIGDIWTKLDKIGEILSKLTNTSVYVRLYTAGAKVRRGRRDER